MLSSASVISPSRSHNTFSSSSTHLAEIAARVIHELSLEAEPYAFDSSSHAMNFAHHPSLFATQQEHHGHDDDGDGAFEEEEEEVVGEEEEYEFAFVCGPPDSSPISADEIFCNGQIKPIRPVIFAEDGSPQPRSFDSGGANKQDPVKVRLPLKQLLMNEDRESTSSLSSSSESDELEGLAPGTYCVWNPKKSSTAAKSSTCEKSRSTGLSSKRWRFRDLLLLNRSNSVHDSGKDAFVFLTPGGKIKKNRNRIGDNEGKDNNHEKPKNGNETKNMGKKRSSLPPKNNYRGDLVGLFANVNGLSKSLNLHPF